MTYLFHKLEQHFNALLHSLNDLDKFQDLSQRFEAETLSLKAKLKEVSFEPYSEQALEHAINLHHDGLMEMMENMYTHIDVQRTRFTTNRNQIGQEILVSFVYAYNRLNELFEFLHTHFGRFISKDKKIPEIKRRLLLPEIHDAKRVINECLVQPFDPCLLKLLNKPFEAILSSKQHSTWHHLSYCRLIIRELNSLLETTSKLEEEDVIWFLFSLNYNTPRFHKYLINYIVDCGSEGNLACLYDFQRKARQTIMHPNIAYKPVYHSLDKMLKKWLDEEIRFIKKTSQLKLSLDGGDTGISLEIKQKCVAMGSVPDVAYYLNLMDDSGVCKIPNPKEFLTIMCHVIRTKNQENISYTSLRQKFSKPEEASKQHVKEHLIKMLNHINSKM